MRRSSPRSPTRRPKGRSIVVLAKEKYGIRAREMSELHATFVPFTAQTRMSGVDVAGSSIRKGAVDSILASVTTSATAVGRGGAVQALKPARQRRSSPRDPGHRRRDRQGGRHAAGRGARTAACSGVVQLKDIVKGGIRERFAELRRMGIRTVMITGDNPDDRRGHRGRGRGRRLPGPGDAGGQAPAHPRRAGAGQAGRHVRRRHQRCAGAGAGRCRRRHEHRHGRRRARPATWSTSTATRPS